MVIINFLVIELPVESRVLFREYLTRLAETPIHDELAEELDKWKRDFGNDLKNNT